MERNRIFGILTALMLLLTACQAGTTGDSSGIPVTEKPVQPEESAQTGTTEAFSYGDLSLTVSNVLEKRTDSVFDGMEDFEYEVYVAAPGAVVTVLEADMFEDDDGQPHADWALLLDPEDSYREGGRLDIVDGMEPVEITPEVTGIYDPESSLYVLKFKLRE